MPTRWLLLAASTLSGTYGMSYPLVGSYEYYTSQQACQLPLDWFWFSGGFGQQSMYDMAPFVPKRCPNITQEDVENDIAHRIRFFTEFQESMMLRAKVYDALDKFGVTYNNCTTPVNVSEFPENVRIYLCTENVQLHLKQEQESSRCEDLWLDGKDSDEEKCEGFLNEMLDGLVSVSEETETDQASVRMHLLTISSLALLLVLMLRIRKCSKSLSMTSQGKLPNFSEDKQVEAKPSVTDKGTQSQKNLPIMADIAQVSDEPLSMEGNWQLVGEPWAIENNMQSEQEGAAVPADRQQRKRMPGRTRQREARRRRNRTPSPQNML